MRRYRELILTLAATAAFGIACSSGGTTRGGGTGTDAACSSAAAKLRSCNLLSEGAVDCEGEITDCHADCFAAAACAELETTLCGPDDVQTTVATCLDGCAPQFTCTSGETIDANWQCDGMDDCADGSDEAGCPEPATFACQDGNETVPLSWQCDGYPDCSDGSDEIGCPARPQEAQLVCPSA